MPTDDSGVGAPPQGWRVHRDEARNGRQDTYFVSSRGRKLRTINEVHQHLKNEIKEANCNEDEALWLRTLERYGQNCRHWAIAKEATDLPECPVFRPTAAEFSEPGRYFQLIMPQMEPYGMCKVVPPPGWTPQPWSGRMPKGFTERSVITSRMRVEDVVRALSPTADGSEPRLAPRVQPLQLFNRGFEQCDDARLTVDEYRALSAATWPDEPCSLAEVERRFWALMAQRPTQAGVGALEVSGLEAARLRMEARQYQERVASQQQPPPPAAGIPHPAATGLVATVLSAVPWEMREAPPVLARPLGRCQPPPPPPPPPAPPESLGSGAVRLPPGGAVRLPPGFIPAAGVRASGKIPFVPSSIAAAPVSGTAPAPKAVAMAAAPLSAAVPTATSAAPAAPAVRPPSSDAPVSPPSSPPPEGEGPGAGAGEGQTTEGAATADAGADLNVIDHPMPEAPPPPASTVAAASSAASSTAGTAAGTAAAAAAPKVVPGASPTYAEAALVEGSAVVVHDVQSRAELNGLRGTVLSVDAARKRYNVRLVGWPKVLALRHTNLRPLTATEAAAHTAAAPAVARAAAPSAVAPTAAPRVGPSAAAPTAAPRVGPSAAAPTAAPRAGPSAASAGAAGGTQALGGTHACPSRAQTAAAGGGGGCPPPLERLESGASDKGAGGKRKLGQCDTPGCDQSRYHLGPCSGELSSKVRAISKKNYKILADEEEEADLTPIYERSSQRRSHVLESAAEDAAFGARAGGGCSATVRAFEALVEREGGVPCALYASDVTYEGPMPPADSLRGEVTATQTRSGILDSLLRASLLRFSPLIPGVNYPMTYVGSRNTFFCWHVEDNHLYATNYLVAGEPKVWYGVPPSHKQEMETVWKAIFPALFQRHPDLHYWKTCIFSPAVLRAFGVPVYRCVAEPGTFMFTSPAAYHTGFNVGFNVAESVNFAFADWLPVGAACLQRYRSPPTRDTTLLHEALVCTAAQHAQPHELGALVSELRRLLQAERLAREAVRRAGVRVPPEPTFLDGTPAGEGEGKPSFAYTWSDGADDSSYFFRWRCRVCRHLCYFSVVQCGCANDAFLCPEHALNTHADDDTSLPASYIHLDEDPEGAIRVASATEGRALSAAGTRAGGLGGGSAWPVPPAAPPLVSPPTSPPSSPPGDGADDAHHGADDAPMADAPPPAGAPTTASNDGTAPPPPAVLPPAAAPAAPTATTAPTVPTAPAASVSAPELQVVRFPCSECGKRLKARVPAGTRKISTTCTSCHAQITASVFVGGAGQEGQAGRARQKAGGPTANRRVGRMMGGAPMADDDDTDSCSGRCNCSAGRRRLIVRHPLQQLELLIDESAARLPPAA